VGEKGELRMDTLEVIKTAHRVDHELGSLVTALTDDEVLRERIAGIHAEWRELAYVVSAHVCGCGASSSPILSGKRKGGPGRPKKNEQVVEQGNTGTAQTAVPSEET
jgi:hypothetical protein